MPDIDDLNVNTSSVEVYILRGPAANERLVVISEEPLGQEIELALRGGLTVSTLIGLSTLLDSDVEDQVMAAFEEIDGVEFCGEATSSIKVVGSDGTNWDEVYKEMKYRIAGIFDAEHDDVHMHMLLAA